jgi:hypothetical protein
VGSRNLPGEFFLGLQWLQTEREWFFFSAATYVFFQLGEKMAKKAAQTLELPTQKILITKIKEGENFGVRHSNDTSVWRSVPKLCW